MTVTANDTVERYDVSGTGPYAFSFRIFDESDLTVCVIEDSTGDSATLTLDTHYTVSGVDDEDGGTVTLVADTATQYASGYTLDIRSNTPNTQPTALTNQGPFSPSAIETAFDRLSRQIQDISRKTLNALRVPDTETTDTSLPSIEERQSKFLRFNSSGEPEAATGIDQSQTLSQSVIGEYLYPRTAAEIAAGVTPVDYAKFPSPWKDISRFVDDNTGVTDVSAQFVNALAAEKNIVVPEGTYNLGTTGLRFVKNGTNFQGGNALFTYSGSGHAIDFTPIGTTWLQDCNLENFGIDCSTSVTSAIRMRASYAHLRNVTAIVRANNSTAWLVDTDFVNGSGGYYNDYIGCNAVGKVGITGGVTSQTAWLFNTSASASTRGPNANTFIRGRVSQFSAPWVIAGTGNVISGPTIEGTASGGTVFLFENAFGADAGCNTNIVNSPYVEGSVGANFVKFGTNSFYNHVERPYVTSIGGGTYLTDTSGNLTNTINDAYGLRFTNVEVSADVRTLDWYEEGTFTPVLAGSSTPGTQTYAADGQKGSFTRIGNRVYFQLYVLMTAKDGTTAGNVRITGLPYAAAAGTNDYSAQTVSDARLDMSAGYSWVGARVDPGTQYVSLVENGDNVAPQLVAAAGVVATTELIISGHYRV